MSLMTFLAFLFLASSFLSLWLKRQPKIWGILICLSLLSGTVAGNISLIGLSFIICLALLWFLYDHKPNALLFLSIVLLSISFKLRLIPGHHPFFITPAFAIGLQNPLIGLFPLAILVPLAKDWKDWVPIMKGFILGCGGIGLLVVLALLSGATQWEFKIPSYLSIRIFSHLVLIAIPEEGFYRGLIQKTLCKYFKNIRFGNVIALILASLLFSLSHIYWSPNLGILAFTFFAGLLYGGVYLFSGKIESAILCHFLFNLIHMVFFSYHAM